MASSPTHADFPTDDSSGLQLKNPKHHHGLNVGNEAHMPATLATAGCPHSKVLVVDARSAVHDAMERALSNLAVCERSLLLLHARSEPEARALLTRHPDIAALFLDAALEAEGNARQLLKFLRNDSRLDAARVVLLVARAGDAPVSEFMREFDISDYKAEQELTPCGLSATITAAMLSFDRIRVLSERNESLEHQVRERTAELQRANESLKMFSHSVAHDLRAPLRHVAGFARILQSQLGARLDDESRKSMERITHAANHMGQLLNDLIEFLRVGYMPVNRAPVDFNKLVPQILHELKPEMGDRVIAWCISELPSAPMDRMLAHKMLKHLLQNAIKFTSKTPETRIEIGVLPREEPERVTVFYVRDNGAGFDMQCAAKLFQPFMRLHAQHEFAGNGIGLALVHGIIQRHGGKTWVEAQAGTGTTVYFSLPG